MKFSALKAIAAMLGLLVAGQGVAWFIAASFGYSFGTPEYGEVAATAAAVSVLFAPFAAMAAMESSP